MKKVKKPYEKPELKGKITFEAAGGGTCCRTVGSPTCTAAAKGTLKNASAQVTS